jgi:hypothetical protein
VTDLQMRARQPGGTDLCQHSDLLHQHRCDQIGRVGTGMGRYSLPAQGWSGRHAQLRRDSTMSQSPFVVASGTHVESETCWLVQNTCKESEHNGSPKAIARQQSESNGGAERKQCQESERNNTNGMSAIEAGWR